MVDIDNLLSKSNEHYLFHGVRSATLSRLISQSENGSILLWGTDHDEHVDNQDNELDTEYVQGQGFLYTTDISDVEMSYQEFCGEGGLVLVLEKIVSEPFDFEHPSDDRQHIVKVEEWKVIGGIRPLFDEDEEVIGEECFSLEEILSQGPHS